jgi:hypothetical protein
LDLLDQRVNETLHDLLGFAIGEEHEAVAECDGHRDRCDEQEAGPCTAHGADRDVGQAKRPSHDLSAE